MDQSAWMSKSLLRVLQILISVYCICFIDVLDAQVPGQPLPKWEAGMLDIHHINTGRGNAAFFILPDGTTMLVDAGELDPTAPRTTSPRNSVIRPNNSKQAFEWIADYIHQFAPQQHGVVLDYALITHFHDDHYGGWYSSAPLSTDKTFSRSGIAGVGDLIPIRVLLTRNYHYPVEPDSILKKSGDSHYKKSWDNYQAFLQSATAKGMRQVFLSPGSNTQIHLNYSPASYPGFSIRNLKSNDAFWTGQDSNVVHRFPTVDVHNTASWPDENSLSNAILLKYGAFSYYTGGDNPGNIFLGDSSWRDTETFLAGITGRVDVATMDHHGNRDALNETLIKTLQPRVWIEQVWSSDHPGHEVLIRLMSKLYAGLRDLFATNMLEPNKLVIGPLVDNSYKSEQGHILVRVVPGGATYYIIILDDSTIERKITKVFGPYQAG